MQGYNFEFENWTDTFAASAAGRFANKDVKHDDKDSIPWWLAGDKVQSTCHSMETRRHMSK